LKEPMVPLRNYGRNSVPKFAPSSSEYLIFLCN
jgi:hypothetical protein